MRRIFLLLILSSCTSLNSNLNESNKNITFNDDLNFEEFKALLIEYAQNNPYPNINE